MYIIRKFYSKFIIFLFFLSLILLETFHIPWKITWIPACLQASHPQTLLAWANFQLTQNYVEQKNLTWLQRLPLYRPDRTFLEHQIFWSFYCDLLNIKLLDSFTYKQCWLIPIHSSYDIFKHWRIKWKTGCMNRPHIVNLAQLDQLLI